MQNQPLDRHVVSPPAQANQPEDLGTMQNQPLHRQPGLALVAHPAETCELLAQALLYPDSAFAGNLHARAGALPDRPSWARGLVDALAGADLEDLQVEHVSLFVNAHGGARCLPYESVYREGQLLGEPARQVAALYAEWGVEQTEDLPDHAAVELAFAAHLARLQPLLATDDERRQAEKALHDFERVHLRAFLPHLAGQLQAGAGLAFYRALGLALEAVFGAPVFGAAHQGTGPSRDPA